MAIDDAGGARCEQCGGPMPGKGRRDRKYCSGSCRTIAWQRRSGQGSAGSAVSRAMAATGVIDRLADELLGRLAAAGGDAEHDHQPPGFDNQDAQEILLHPPISANGFNVPVGNGKNPDLMSKPKTPNLAALLLKAAAQLPQARQSAGRPGKPLTIEELGNPIIYRLPSNADKSRRPHDEDASQHGLMVISSKPRAPGPEEKELEPALDPSNELKTLKAKIVRLEKRNKTLKKAVRDWEDRSGALQDEANELRKAQKKPPPAWPDGDPLVLLMRTKVMLQHRIAIQSAERGHPSDSGRRLPDDTPETWDAAARHAAHSARQRYFTLCQRKWPDKTKWRVEGKRLDPASEEKLLRRERKKIYELEMELNWHKPSGTPK